MSILPSNASDTTATSKLAPHLRTQHRAAAFVTTRRHEWLKASTWSAFCAAHPPDVSSTTCDCAHRGLVVQGHTQCRAVALKRTAQGQAAWQCSAPYHVARVQRLLQCLLDLVCGHHAAVRGLLSGLLSGPLWWCRNREQRNKFCQLTPGQTLPRKQRGNIVSNSKEQNRTLCTVWKLVGLQ